jgi:hypothetical protein
MYRGRSPHAEKRKIRTNSVNFDVHDRWEKTRTDKQLLDFRTCVYHRVYEDMGYNTSTVRFSRRSVFEIVNYTLICL